MDDFLAALALVFVIEGALYALFPERMRAMLTAVLETPDAALRRAGLFAAVGGVFVVWMIRG